MKGIDATTLVLLLIVAVIGVACMVIAALRGKSKEIEGEVKLGPHTTKIRITGYEGSEHQPPTSAVKPKSSRAHSKNRSWFFRHWRAVLIMTLMFILVGLPIGWWFAQPAPWRMLLRYEFSEMISLLRHGSKEPLNITRGQATLDRVTRMVEMRTDNLAHDRYKPEEIWIVDHYWQYWNTTNLREYLSVNQTFVARGGKIHRMFFLSDREMRNPEVQTMLQAQCQIGRLSAAQTGNGFELWRADPKMMKDREEYEAVSQAFSQLPGTDKNFDNFDAMQFNDTLYYSSDFSTDYRVMGSSTWVFDPAQVSKIDLRPLFKKSIAQRISCDQPLPVMSAEKTGGALE
jgi:hypothetical protein